ncbi:hypothetical protein PBY51_023814 [Eleginops maclovinus]|uniref:Uncharacterized protein n=1 Tax=Eleginops maclovinus TaxID=56733 RepID=A0AAN7X1M7_ELEMC|nr:hypothetical protein PBY51_023814 [Eleginops maclovinus]
MSVNKKLYLNAPEGTRELPPIPEVRENRRLKCVMGERDTTCTGSAIPLHWSLRQELVLTPSRTHRAGADKATLREAF